MTTVTDQAINILENTAAILKKTQINWKKCPKERMTTGYLETRIKSLEDYWNTFKNAHEILVKNTTRDQRGLMSYFVNEEFFIQEDLYLCLHGDFKDMLAKTRASDAPYTHYHGNISIEDSCCSQVKLPPIKIPTFTGKYDEWPTFHDLFNTLVHSSSLSRVQKLYYLKTSVSGEAAAILNHIQITDDNYEQAWELMKNRYGNKRLIVNSILRRLFTQKKLSTQNASQLKLLLDSTTECLNHLKNLKISTDSWDILIIFLVVQKLDPESHKQWEEYTYKHNSEEMPTWDSLKNFLESKFRTLELASTPSASHDKPTKIRTFHVTTTPNSKTCILCKEHHTLSRCEEFLKMNPTERSEYVKKNRICFNCLAPGHKIFKCTVRLFCKKCSRRHHSLLHESRNTKEEEENEDSAEETRVHTMIASNSPVTYNNFALLATALLTVRGESGHTTVLKTLIDLGSQACFISEKAAQTLRLKRYNTNRIVTGIESTRVAVKEQVNVQVLSQRDPCYGLPIQAFIMSKQISHKIPKIKATTLKQWSHITGLDLADPDYFTSGPIDLILGANEYAKILRQGLVKGPPGTPCAQNTALGWILFGEIDTKTSRKDNTMHQQSMKGKIDTNTKKIFSNSKELSREIKETRNK